MKDQVRAKKKRRTREKFRLGRPMHGGIVRSIPDCPRLHCESGWIRGKRAGARERLVWLIYLRPEPRPPALAKFLTFSRAGAGRPGMSKRHPLPLAALVALIRERGPIRVCAVGGDPDEGMTLTAGRIVCDPISARPKYAWSNVRNVGGLAEAETAIAQDSDPCAVLWWPDMHTVSSADAEALLERMRDARAA